ncbi:MAG: hypothetical protein M3011_07435 [Actinomycetota bacterium]|nr:hypothetical protein [Actinomycetota bacterium]
MRSRLASLAVVSVLAVACSGGGGGSSSARVSVTGRVEVASGGRALQLIDGIRTLHAGDRVKVDSGRALIRLNGDRQLELRNGSEVTLAAASGEPNLKPSLVSGDLLVTAPGDTVALGVTVADSEASVTGGSARLSRASATTVASYDADLTVASAGRSLKVPALRQVAVPAAGLLPGRPSPLIFKTGDSWDQRFLGDAIDLGNQLVARSRGFTAQLGPGEGRTAGFYRQVLPALDNEPSFDVASLGGDRSPGEGLVGLAIVVQGKRGAFNDRLASVLAFHDDGAAWGLVALDQGVSRAPLLAGVDEAIGRGPLSVAEAPPPVASPAAGRSTSPSPAVPVPSGGGDVTAPTPPVSSPSPEAPTGAGPVNTGAPVVDNTVNSLVNVLNGLLGGLGQK